MIEQLVVPDSKHDPEWSDFEASVRVRNEVEAGTLGSDALMQGPEELLPKFRSNPERVRQLFAARVDGQMVGRAMVTSRPKMTDGPADLIVDVLPIYRGRGIGAALLDRVEEIARGLDVSALQCTVVQSADPTSDAGGRFLRFHGYNLEQVVRVSALDLTSPAAEAATAQDVTSDDFEMVSWLGPTPPKWVEDLAVLRTRMSTDVPSAGMVSVVDTWDAARIVENDAREVATGRTLFTAAAEHRPSGRLVGFTEMAGPVAGSAAMQGATLVLLESRGHRLGLRLKSEALQLLIARAPDATQVVTFNAEENRPMLDVNEALGFSAIGTEGAWQKRARE